MKLPQLYAIAKQNKIVGRSTMNKPELLALLTEKGLLPDESIEVLPKEKSDHPRYAYLKLIRRNPKRVIVEDVDTGEISEYFSIYKAGKALGVNCKRLITNAEKIMDKKYLINFPGN